MKVKIIRDFRVDGVPYRAGEIAEFEDDFAKKRILGGLAGKITRKKKVSDSETITPKTTE